MCCFLAINFGHPFVLKRCSFGRWTWVEVSLPFVTSKKVYFQKFSSIFHLASITESRVTEMFAWYRNTRYPVATRNLVFLVLFWQFNSSNQTNIFYWAIVTNWDLNLTILCNIQIFWAFEFEYFKAARLDNSQMTPKPSTRKSYIACILFVDMSNSPFMLNCRNTRIFSHCSNFLSSTSRQYRQEYIV